MKKILLVFLLILGFSSGACANTNKHKSNIDKVKIGVYVDYIYGFSSDNNNFKMIVWLWSVSDSNYTMNDLEVVNSVNAETLMSYSEFKDGKYWVSKKLKLTMVHIWDLKRYPLDKQFVNIIIEDGDKDIKSLMFEDDTNSKLSPHLHVNGWLPNLKANIWGSCSLHKMDSNFGDPDLNCNKSTYSQVKYSFVLDRDTKRGVLTVMLPIIMSFFIAWLGFLITRDFAIKTTLFLSSLFLLIGSKTVTDAKTIGFSGTTLVDLMQGITFTAIFIFLISIIYSLRNQKVSDKQMMLVNNILAIVVLIGYVGAILFGIEYYK